MKEQKNYKFTAGDWVFVDGHVTKINKDIINSNHTNIKDIVLKPDLLYSLGFSEWAGVDGIHYIIESGEDSRLCCNLDNKMVRLDDILHKDATSVRGLQNIIREYYKRFPHHTGEFNFLVRRINKYFTEKK